MNSANFNVTAMNYQELRELSQSINSNGEKIYNSLNHIKSTFARMQDAGFAGSTLRAVIDTLDKIGGLPEDVRRTCQSFKNYAEQAIEEVEASENKISGTLTAIINSDPKTFELPDWYKKEKFANTGNSVNIDEIS